MMNKKTRIGEKLTLWRVKYDTDIGPAAGKSGYEIHEEIRVEIVAEKNVRGSWGGGKAKGYKVREVGGKREWTCNWEHFDDASTMPMFYWVSGDGDEYVDAKQASNNYQSQYYLPNGDKALMPLGCKRCEKHSLVHDETEKCLECDLEETYGKCDFSVAKPPAVDDESYLAHCSRLWQPGDTVVIQADDARVHINGKGYDIPQGTVGTILRFAERHLGRADRNHEEPGVYSDHNTVVFSPQNQALIDAKISEVVLSSYQMALVNHSVLKERAAEQASLGNWPPKEEKIRDLPNTKFWEGDKVRLLDPKLWARLPEPDLGFLKRSQEPYLKEICGDQIKTFVEHYEKMLRLLVEGKERDSVITRIDYRAANDPRLKRDGGGIYDVECPGGGGSYCYVAEDKLKLVERGNVWKYYHNEPLAFADLKEEANFYYNIGKYEEVRNPKHNLYKWTIEEMLDAISKGIVHSFNVTSNPFIPLSERSEKQLFFHNAVRFNDLELGKRVARETLKVFNWPIPTWCENGK